MIATARCAFRVYMSHFVDDFSSSASVGERLDAFLQIPASSAWPVLVGGGFLSVTIPLKNTSQEWNA
jgi:hypothetical protein